MAAALPLDDAFAVSRNTTWRRFRRHRVALIGAVVLGLMALFATLGHVVYPVDPNAIDQVNWTGYPLAPGIAGHILGTDENGRDLLARLISGAQISLTVAVSAVVMQVVDRHGARGASPATTAAGSTSGSCASPTSCSRFRSCRCCWC